MRVLIFIFLVLSLTGWTGVSSARTLPQRDWSQIEFSLLTLGANSTLYTAAGHTLVRVKDGVRGTDQVYNWGIFNFRTENFVWKYYRSTLMYKLMITPTDFYLRHLRSREPRSILEETLVLSPDEKKIFMDELIWWSRPENRLYRYHEYRKNCATVVRDIIDKATGGRLKAATGTVYNNKTWRSFWRHYFSWHILVETGADLLFNSEIDEQISGWDEMYIPLQLSHYVNELQLVGERRRILDIPFRKTTPVNGYGLFWIFLGIPLAGAAWLLRRDPAGKAGLICAGLAAAFQGLLGTLYGTVIPLTALLSERSYFHFGANFWLFWPVDLLLLIAAFYWLRGHPLPDGGRLRRWLRWLCLAHGAGHLAWLLLWIVGIIRQNIFSELWSVWPLSLLLMLLIYRRLIPQPGPT